MDIRIRRLGIMASSLHAPLSPLWKRKVSLPILPRESRYLPFLREESKPSKLFPKLRSTVSGQDGGLESDLDAGALENRCKMWLSEKLLSLTGEVLSRELEKGSISDSDLAEIALRLSYVGKNDRALEVYEWMDANRMEFQPSVLANFIEVICKTRGVEAARSFFKRIDPGFDSSDHRARNYPAYAKILQFINDKMEFSRASLDTFSDVAEKTASSVVLLKVPTGDYKSFRTFGIGFFIDEKTIVTCAHLIVNRADPTGPLIDQVVVRFTDGTLVFAKPVVCNLATDLALLQIDHNDERIRGAVYTPLKFASATVRRGDWVLAFRSPLRLDSLSVGVITHSERLPRDLFGAVDNLLGYPGQGCLGSSLLNTDGELIGVFCSGLIVPQDQVKERAKQLGWFGLAIPADSVAQLLLHIQFI